MFKITDSRGFQITFPNGYTASVQWGPDNYCSNRCIQWPRENGEDLAAENAEVAVLTPSGEVLEKMIIGWQEPLEVAAFIAQVAAMDPAPVAKG